MRKFKNSLLNIVLILSVVTSLCSALYEDQIGKFDWRKKFVGTVKFGYFDAQNADKSIVATDENVLAAISSKNGDILWRKVFETDNTRGEIKFLHVTRDGKSIASHSSEQSPFDIITVNGNNPFFFRGYNMNNGNLLWEWSITATSQNPENSQFFFREHNIYHVLPVWNSHIEVTEYHASTGQQSKPTTSSIFAAYITKDNCVLSGQYFACIVKEQLLVIDLIADQNNLRTKAIESPNSSIKVIRGKDNIIQVGKSVLNLEDLSVIYENNNDAELYVESDKIIQVVQKEKEVKILTDSADLTAIADLPETLDNNLKIMATKCKAKRDDANQIACRFLMSTDDGALALVQQGKIKWVREESLTKITAVEFIELSLSDAQGAIEEELNSGDADILSSLYRRLHSQYGMVKNIALHLLGLGPPPSFSQRAGLVRDDFGLHKMMVILTKSGKLFGIDNVSGKQHWVRVLKNSEGFSNGQGMRLLVQRTSKFYPLPTQCVVIARDKSTGNGLIFQFNPLSGQGIDKGLLNLDYKIQQASLLNYGDNFLRPILLVDSDDKVHVLPESSLKQVDGFYFYTVNKQTGFLNGYVIQHENDKAELLPTWILNLGGSDNEQKITHVVSKNPIERVHSQGRVLADRSVLYKYINPNLIAVVTEGPDSIHKYMLNVHLIDVVSGAIVFSMNHRRAKGPVRIVHSENWLVYSFYNEKIRRNEITSIELYEGKTQTNSTIWSSLNAPPSPLVERQTYIISSSIAALRETITEKGITNKHVLMALDSGAVVEMPWMLLDPRRNSMVPTEYEGIIPYIPELVIQHENIINYNQTIAKINGIYTAPSGLESTCLVMVYGLDIFVTRVSPSKTFDLLKEDFDYFLISTVLIGLITASYVVKHLAAKKTIKQAWK
ncbi:ER membrane protein complex subunit 1 isoform X2 [Chironomus tepperi]|uniref:ER membrane protein complex subunit 1 isoform X2 n=1 Tax=Chironomus tepperi TaxID=113505 RepID=UPI00391F2400